ncbi:hypothetical protein CHELA40_14527 [Chelatococcus asaccharovorans]|nr:hypothetical protein CHELA17_61093 [Chelatococcus asaccharovorans]CAH1678154.1 hypothetical protein CHELA40_14527 [Chelatococcus asaccharovorans]
MAVALSHDVVVDGITWDAGQAPQCSSTRVTARQQRSFAGPVLSKLSKFSRLSPPVKRTIAGSNPCFLDTAPSELKKAA